MEALHNQELTYMYVNVTYKLFIFLIPGTLLFNLSFEICNNNILLHFNFNYLVCKYYISLTFMQTSHTTHLLFYNE